MSVIRALLVSLALCAVYAAPAEAAQPGIPDAVIKHLLAFRGSPTDPFGGAGIRRLHVVTMRRWAAISWGTPVVCNTTTTAGTTACSATITIANSSTDYMVCWAWANNVANDFSTADVVLDSVGVNVNSDGDTHFSLINVTGRDLAVWRFTNPPTVTGVLVDFSGLDSGARDGAGCVVGTGINPADPDDAPLQEVTGTAGASFACDAHTAGAGDHIFAIAAWGNTSTPTINAATSNATALSPSAPTAGPNGQSAAAYDADGGETDSIDWTLASGPAASCVSWVVNVDPGGAPAATGSRRSLLGAGR